MARNVYSVAEVNRYISKMFTQDFVLRNICVKGEISNCKYHSSGHIYFTLKDETGAIKCVMFRGNRGGLNFQMKEGDKVNVTGSIEIFDRDGVYQLYAREIKLDGSGDLFLRFEALKQELEEMGMFAPEYKQPIPKYAKTVGIVTASTGAAIQDIRNVSRRRNPSVQLILYPALVQGQGAAESIVRGIEMLDRYGVDVIIIGRGGGSIEDLWGFNEEIVARAIFNCRTPIVSAVGHETDWTIADFVSDLRAPTPSAAAELCVFSQETVTQQLQHYRYALNRSMETKLSHMRERLTYTQKQILMLSPQYRIRENELRLAKSSDRLNMAIQMKLKDRKMRLALLAKALEGNSPLRKLESGFAYVAQEDGSRLTSVKDASISSDLTIYVTDGQITATVKDIALKGEVSRIHE